MIKQVHTQTLNVEITIVACGQEKDLLDDHDAIDYAISNMIESLPNYNQGILASDGLVTDRSKVKVSYKDDEAIDDGEFDQELGL